MTTGPRRVPSDGAPLGWSGWVGGCAPRVGVPVPRVERAPPPYDGAGSGILPPGSAPRTRANAPTKRPALKARGQPPRLFRGFFAAVRALAMGRVNGLSPALPLL